MTDVFLVRGTNYQVLGQLGEGSFAVVYAARTEDGGDKIAIKRSSALEEEDIAGCKQEIAIMKRIKHDSIVPALNSETKSRGDTITSLIVMPFAQHGNLVAVINKYLKHDKLMSEKTVLTVLNNVAAGVAELHAQNSPIAHRDLKAENVLCYSPFSYKICDFGSSSVYSYQCSTGRDMMWLDEELNRKTTLAYRAPEQCMLMAKLRIDQRVDNWALGVILYLATFRECPFPDSSVAIANAQYTLPPRGSYSQDLVDLIPYILCTDADKRPTAHDVAEKAACLLRSNYPSAPALPTSRPPSQTPQAQHPSLSKPPTAAELAAAAAGAKAKPKPKAKSLSQQTPQQQPQQQQQQAQPQSRLFGMLEWSDSAAAPTAAQPTAAASSNLFATAAVPAQPQQPQQQQSSLFAPAPSTQPPQA
eukprot:Rhum_TRINITY_DN9951_c0_g1::Rhum_TRINITY_DN9951_c0_g1_i1::g.35980::m.35980/K08853/AAK; AP2-associated kinase